MQPYTLKNGTIRRRGHPLELIEVMMELNRLHNADINLRFAQRQIEHGCIGMTCNECRQWYDENLNKKQ
jgi:hypothetical protein